MDTKTLILKLKLLNYVLANQYNSLRSDNRIRSLKYVINSFLESMNTHRRALITLFEYFHETDDNENIRSTFASFYSHYKSLRRFTEETCKDRLASFDSHFVDVAITEINSSRFHGSHYRGWLSEFVAGKDTIHVLYLRINILGIILDSIAGEIGLHDRLSNIVREIIFPPEFHQAGVSILSYFREVLLQKYPDISVGISIQQENELVTMTITLPDGKKEIVSKALRDYGMVITGKLDPHSFLDNEIHIMALQHKLELASLEVRHTKDLLYSERNQFQKRVDNLEQEVQRLYSIVRTNLDQDPPMVQLLKLLKGYQTNNKELIDKIISILERDLTEKDEHDVKEALSELKQKEPTLFQKVYEVLIWGTLSSAAGNYLYNWINAIYITFK